MDLRAINVLSLCAGAGGLDLGLKLALPTARTVCYAEIEAYACEVLASRMEEGRLDDAPIWTDLRTFYGRPWRGVVDCIIGGYPCQPFSVAGKQRGVDDPRHLWPYIARIIKQVEPTFCFFENVSNHLRVGFSDVARDLHALGYDVAADLFTASEVGAPHKRERLFILAYTKNRDRRRGVSPAEEGARSHDIWRRRPSSGSDRLADASSAGLEGFDAEQPEGTDRQCSGRTTGPQGRALGIFPPGPNEFVAWTDVLANSPQLEPAIRRMAHGLANRVDRLRLCGNGVVPQQAALAFTSLYGDLHG